MRRIAIKIVLCAAIVVVGGIGAIALTTYRASTHSRETVDAISMEVPPPVKVHVVEPTPLRDSIILSGAVIPWKDITMSSESSGRIVRFDAEEGQVVHEGQVLVQLDTASLETQLAEVKARISLASRELERLKSLKEKGVSAVRDYDRAFAESSVLQAQLNSLKVAIEKATVRAPARARVNRNLMSLGEYTDPGSPLVHLVQTDSVKLIVGIPERDRPYFELGDEVNCLLDAYPGEIFTGWIYNIQPAADMNTRTFTTSIALANSKQRVSPGMIGRAELVRATYDGAITVPLFALLTIEEKRYVFVDVDSKAVLREVQPGIVKGDEVQITDGLNAGDRVIVVGHRDLRPQQPVDVVEVIQ